MPEWGERQPDGSVKVYNENGLVRQESWEQNQGLTGGGGAPAAAGGGTYNTPNGPKTLEQIRSELQRAGYNGPTDAASLLAAYNRTSMGGGGGGTGGMAGSAGLQDLLNQVAQSNKEEWELRKQQALHAMQMATNADERAQAQMELQKAEFELSKIKFGGELISAAASMDRPEDWWKYGTFTAGGRNLITALNGNQAIGKVTPSGVSTPATLETLMRDLGLSTGSGAAAPTPTQATVGTQNTPGTIPQATGVAPNGGAPTAPQMAQNTPAGALPAEMVPLPGQINPAVWDSYSPTQKSLILGLAKEGRTSSGYWTSDDFQAAIDATRPQGTAPKNVRTSFGNFR